ncbi:transposase IS116/IS110/IS902 family protein [Mucilaginibacter frigoritolerans]|uniref:Transposase IS116/IS110/IS902 family protein n=1 Tax=Mucilaginibacter frigoritolerans TaxID=652788 RepID=A0A562UCC8_9SPHI|nr:transposase [Mucilaginibacter frigoritolerans]TWJ03496.1 transposase IS116/IS110/IS902 family protein [Mucilaginibacter frigoritolerans]
MKQQVIEDVNIMPQLDRAGGLDMHKNKIIGFISCKDGSNQEFREFGTYTCELQGYHRTQLQMLLADYDHVQKQVDFLDKSIADIIREHYAQASECFDSISGIGVKSAEIIISEAGKDMSRFPSADHFTAWCGIAPGNNESAGKRKNTSIKKGNSYLRVAIVGAAWAAVRMKDSYWHALFDKLRKRMKAQKAIVAVTRRLLKVVHNTLETLTIYKEKGIAHFVELQAKAGLYYNSKLSWPQTNTD